MYTTHDTQPAPRAAKASPEGRWGASWRRMVFWRAFVIGIGISGCQDAACTVYPCPESRALSIVLTSAATGAAIANGTLTVTAPVTTTEPCIGSCDLYGPAGTYTFEVSAPGFATVHDSVVVHGTNPACGCGSATTANVTIALAPAAGSDLMPKLTRSPSNLALLPSAWGSEAAGSLRSPAATIMERRGRAPRR